MELDSDKAIICFGHVPPHFSVTDSSLIFLSENDIGVANSWVFGEKYPDLMRHGYTLSEYSALFALCRRLREEGKEPRRLILTQYRKFVTKRNIGTIAANMPYVNTIPGNGLTLARNDFDPLSGNFLVSRPIDLKMSVLDQYSKVHILKDLLAFVSDSIGREVINNAEAKNMLDSRFLIPAPALGCYEGKSFMEIFTVLEQAATYFLTRSYQPRSGYQRRVLGFCLERLHSYLLLKRLGFPNLRTENFGYQIVVSETPKVQPTI